MKTINIKPGLLLTVALVMLLSGCQTAPTDVLTMEETEAPPPTATPLPTETATLKPTNTPTLTPTATPIPAWLIALEEQGFDVENGKVFKGDNLVFEIEGKDAIFNIDGNDVRYPLSYVNLDETGDIEVVVPAEEISPGFLEEELDEQSLNTVLSVCREGEMCKFPEDLSSVDWDHKIQVPVLDEDGFDKYDEEGEMVTEPMSIWEYLHREFEKIGGYTEFVITEDGEVIDVPAPQLGLPDSIDDVIRISPEAEEAYRANLNVFEDLILYNRPDLVAELKNHPAWDNQGVGIPLDRNIEGTFTEISHNNIHGGLFSLYIIERGGVEHMVLGIPTDLIYNNKERPRLSYLGVISVDVELHEAIDYFSKYGDDYFWGMLEWLSSGEMYGGYVFFTTDWEENAEINEIFKKLSEMTKAEGGEITKEEAEKLMKEILYARKIVTYEPVNQ